MSEIFRPAQPSPVEAKPEPVAEPTSEVFESKVETSVEREYKDSLEVWETESKKKFSNEYFDTHKIGNEFMVKMPISQIDKFVRGEMEDRSYEKTTANYKKILQEVEKEIGSENLNLFERLRKITGYIKAFNKVREAKKKLGAYKQDVGLA